MGKRTKRPGFSFNKSSSVLRLDNSAFLCSETDAVGAGIRATGRSGDVGRIVTFGAGIRATGRSGDVGRIVDEVGAGILANGSRGVAGRFDEVGAGMCCSTKHDAGGLTLCRQAAESGAETRIMQCLTWLLNKLKPLSSPRLSLRLERFGSSTGCIVHQSEGGASIRLAFRLNCGLDLLTAPKQIASRGQALGLFSCHWLASESKRAACSSSCPVRILQTSESCGSSGPRPSGTTGVQSICSLTAGSEASECEGLPTLTTAPPPTEAQTVLKLTIGQAPPADLRDDIGPA